MNFPAHSNLTRLFIPFAAIVFIAVQPLYRSKAADGSAQIKFGVCDWTIGRTGSPTALETAARIGLDGVQVSLVPEGDSLALAKPELQRAYLAACEKTELRIPSFAVGEMNNVPLKSDPRAEKWLTEGIDIAAAMDVGIILIPFFGRGDLRSDPEGVRAVVSVLRKHAPKAQKAGVVLALESYLSAEQHIEILDAVGSTAVKVYYDVANSREAGYDILKEIRLLGDRISEIHAKDNQDLYGKGSTDFPAVRKAMNDIAYTEWLVIEGTKLPLGVEPSIRFDLDYLKGVFGGAGK
jgi:L-ribulose-5-phosphate 3-epimerase